MVQLYLWDNILSENDLVTSTFDRCLQQYGQSGYFDEVDIRKSGENQLI